MSFLSKCSTETIASAAKALADGHLVAFPTETVYGLGADATNPDAIARIYSTKGRPADHPLIIHIPSIDAMGEWAVDISHYAISLARDFWPGPMTLILNRSELAKDFVTGNQESVGLRVPEHPIALALLLQFAALGGKGVAAPSANRFGAVSPTTAQDVAEELNSYLLPGDLILDGGPCNVGVESTIIDCTGEAPRILRPGAITPEMVKQSTGLDLDESIYTPTIRVSGSLESHYSPKARVTLDVEAIAGQGLIAMAEIKTPEGVIRLAAPSTIDQYARELYSALRAADSQGLTHVVANAPEGEGLAAAIRDRLQRAAHS
jgi:L-threonylcarbamoyladenylate synthase